MKNKLLYLGLLLTTCLACSVLAFWAGYYKGKHVETKQPDSEIKSASSARKPARALPNSVPLTPTAAIPITTAKEIEVFGGEMANKRYQLLCTLANVSDLWVRMLLKDDNYVGFFVQDERGDLYQYCFASKAEYGKDIIALPRGTPLKLIGTIIKKEQRFCLMVEEMSQ